jgi:gliding motility-associated protein GldM
MAGGKETPRQKMIGMMYLVLTALLALNISKEVLDGFVKVEKSLNGTQETLAEKVRDSRETLSEKYLGNQETVGPFAEIAERVSKKSGDLQDYIVQLKAHAMAASEGKLLEVETYYGKNEFGRDTVRSLALHQKKDEYQELTAFMGVANINNPLFDESNQWSAAYLKKALENYRDELKTITFLDHRGQERALPEALKAQLDDRFSFPDGTYNDKPVPWESATFYHVPLAATMPLMSKMLIDVQDAEADILKWLLSGIDAKSYKFTDLKPLVVPMSSIVMKGDTLRADVLLSAFDPTKKAEIYVEDANWSGTPEEYTMDPENVLDLGELSSLELDSLGIGKLAMSTKNLAYGDYVFRGVLNHTKPDGSPESIKFVTPRITVSQPALVVSPTKMNVFYRGLENPVEISVPGVAAENIRPTINNGHKLKRTSSGWVVIPNKSENVREAIISVVATLEDGTEMRMPNKEFRVKRIPDPVPSLGTANFLSPDVSKAQMSSPPPVFADLENFDFEVQSEVVGFTFAFTKNGAFVELPSNSRMFTQEMREVAKRFRVGDTFYLNDIKALMPDGSKRTLPSLKLNVSQ